MNYWIVSSHEFMLHATCEGAIAEADRLSTKVGKPFHVYRVKDKLVPSGKYIRVATTVPLAEVRHSSAVREGK